jgi:CO/xanthine dehydrogenase Mo-binding subunit
MAYKLLGKDFTPPDLRGKVTGKAKYAEDFRVEGMVFCKLLLSPMPHARVTSRPRALAKTSSPIIRITSANRFWRLRLLTKRQHPTRLSR